MGSVAVFPKCSHPFNFQLIVRLVDDSDITKIVTQLGSETRISPVRVTTFGCTANCEHEKSRVDHVLWHQPWDGGIQLGCVKGHLLIFVAPVDGSRVIINTE